MNIQDRQKRHQRALNLFAAEEREQTLASIALREAKLNRDSIVPITDAPENGADEETAMLGRLQALDHSSETAILDAHQQLNNARLHSRHLSSKDEELQRLNALIDGVQHGTDDGYGDEDIIEAEVVKEAETLRSKQQTPKP